MGSKARNSFGVIFIMLFLLAIMAAAVIFERRSVFGSTDRRTNEAGMEQLAEALIQYHSDTGVQPVSLRALLKAWDAESSLVDSWGNFYSCSFREDSFRLVSPGPDRILGTGDDIVLEKKMVVKADR